MHGVLRTALGIAAGSAAIVLLEPRARPRRVVSIMRRALGSRRVLDRSLADEVEARLLELTPHASSIHVSAEHGCVLLTGDVRTEERAQLVRAAASVPGVDSVVDLMTERPLGEQQARRDLARAQPRGRSTERSPASGALEIGAGLGLAIAAFRVRGAAGVALGASGVLLAAAGIASVIPSLRRLFGRRVRAEASVIVGAAAPDVFAVVRALDNAPRWLRHARSVERRGPRRYVWTFEGDDMAPIAWEADVTALLYNRRIAWKSAPKSAVSARGEIDIVEVAPGRTRVTARLSYSFPFGKHGRAMRDAMGSDPSRSLAEDLERLRAIVHETSGGMSLATR